MEESVEKEIMRCVRCGACMEKCPVYRVTRREGGVARGKLALVKARDDGRLEWSKRYDFFLSACLLCGSCTESCPNAVDTVSVVQAARAKTARARKGGWFKRQVLRRFLPSKKLLPRLLKGARATRALWAAKVPADSGLHIRLLKGPGGQRHRIPPIVRPFFTDRDLPRAHEGQGTRVALFSGCVTDYLRPQAGDSALRALDHLGASVVVPPGQGCCGLPAWGSGEIEAAAKLARRNIDAFLPVNEPWPEVITTPCASCAAMLRNHIAPLVAGDEDYEARARAFSERVVPFSRLWCRLSGADRDPAAGSSDGVLLTYHDPCHLAKELEEREAPRRLLGSLAAARFIEMKRADDCCGHGGSFSVSHYDLSLDIVGPKVAAVIESGAEILVTECSGCVLQLSEAMARKRKGFEVITTAEAVDRYLLADRAPGAKGGKYAQDGAQGKE